MIQCNLPCRGAEHHLQMEKQGKTGDFSAQPSGSSSHLPPLGCDGCDSQKTWIKFLSQTFAEAGSEGLLPGKHR